MYRLIGLPLLLALSLLAGCSQVGGVQSADQSVSESGLLPRAAGLDHVSAAMAFDLASARVYVAPLQLDYRPSRDGRARLREADFRLDAGERGRLQQLVAESFAGRFLQPRNSSLVAAADGADYRLQLRFRDFAPSAPLAAPTWARSFYTQRSAVATVVGELYNRDGQLVMEFRDRRSIGENPGAGLGGGDLQRFSDVAFWADMRTDLGRLFASLDRALR